MTACTLIGVLDDGWESLTDEARARIRRADRIVGAKRLLALLAPHFSPGAQTMPMDGALASVPDWILAAREENRPVVILATGDPLCHGVGALLSARLREKAGDDFVNVHLEILPNLSTLQLACARFHRPWNDILVSSCHTRDTGEWHFGATPEHALYPALRAIARHPRVFLLTSPENDPARLARALLSAGYESGELTLSAACRLNLPDETLFHRMTLQEAAQTVFPNPSVVFIDRGVDAPMPAFGFGDAEYLQRAPEKGLITRQEARSLALAKMRISPDAVVWDIGAGSGSVGLEAARLAPSGHAWAIEKNPDDAANARANARRFKITNYTLREGKAPEGLDTWPDPDAAFVGGSGGNLSELIGLILKRLKPGGRLVLNFVTLENLAAAQSALNGAKAEWEVVQLQASRSQPILGMRRMAAQNPVWVITAYPTRGTLA